MLEFDIVHEKVYTFCWRSEICLKRVFFFRKKYLEINICLFRDGLQNSFLIVSEFKQITQLLFPLKLPENHTFSDYFRRNRSQAGMFHSSILHKKSMVEFPHKSWQGLTDRKIFKTSSRVGAFLPTIPF